MTQNYVSHLECSITGKKYEANAPIISADTDSYQKSSVDNSIAELWKQIKELIPENASVIIHPPYQKKPYAYYFYPECFHE